MLFDRDSKSDWLSRNFKLDLAHRSPTARTEPDCLPVVVPVAVSSSDLRAD